MYLSVSQTKNIPQSERSSIGLLKNSNMLAKIVLITALFALAVGQIGLNEIEEYGGPFEPIPYSFGYAIKDVHGEQHRQEKSDGAGVVTGSYGFVDEHGIHRQVYYIADHLGFRAKIVTNEPVKGLYCWNNHRPIFKRPRSQRSTCLTNDNYLYNLTDFTG
ncbi:uncharacterized protein NPIL_443021 [Nephila pilipes]|uniref:Cuticular protein n=1 Tax=Nephila pilipes TaxID=299642 RepID=A0A8X6TM99_NEPPI|nr:uncharacterized protein NPIL_443021 [Nephila pilipes]